MKLRSFIPHPAVEHDELWVHEGFHDVSQATLQDLLPSCKFNVNPSLCPILAALPLEFGIRTSLCCSLNIRESAGCLQAYQSVKPRIQDIMDEIVGECVNDPKQRPSPVSRLGSQISGDADEERWHIFVTGHSMGGAKATLCAYELAVSHCGACPLPAHGEGWYAVCASCCLPRHERQLTGSA